MICRFARDDGAYVLGALSPADRQAFELHLSGCADCTRAVGELAGLPGLLGSVGATVIEEKEDEAPVPATLLPALAREVRHARRRRTWAAAVLAAAIAVVALAVGQAARDDASAPTEAAAGSSADDQSPPAVAPRRMRPVGDVPVRAAVSLEQVTWGTRLELACTYNSQWVEDALPPAVDYTLYVRTGGGPAERVGSWRAVDGRRMQFTAGTAATAEELRSVEVRTTEGRVVLRLAT